MEHVTRWIGDGVELLQVRERDLSGRDLAALTRAVVAIPNPHGTKIIVNDRADVAMACGADGVHLRDESPSAALFSKPGFIVTVACHNVEDPSRLTGADYVLLAPIFAPLSKTDNRRPLDLDGIREFTRRSSVKVLALGGITRENARACLDAGAAGVAGITYFEQ